MKLLLLAALCALASTPARGQDPPAEKAPNPRMGKAVRSPQVHLDRRVTFRFRAPGAKVVALLREGVPPQAMKKNEGGTWSFTTDPLPADLYVYRFSVDGVTLSDPANPLAKPVVTGGHESLVHIPGPASLVWEPNDVAHGTLHRHLYRSKLVGEARDFWVYTPPGYDPSAEQKYPVLYLLHGVMEDAGAWTMAGRAHIILDNLIARGQAKPMLIVNPLGYGFPDVPDRVSELFTAWDQQTIMDAFANTLLDEVIPQVERTYRTSADREGRAIAGLSMGGAQALYVGLRNLDRFAWIGSFSGAFLMFGSAGFDKWFPDMSEAVNPRIRLLWIACGEEDFLLRANRVYKDWLRKREVRFSETETPGAHTWRVWRRNLAEFAPLLFRPAKPPD